MAVVSRDSRFSFSRARGSMDAARSKEVQMAVLAIFIAMLVSSAALVANGIVRLFVPGGNAFVTVGARIGEIALVCATLAALSAIPFRGKRHFLLAAAVASLQFAAAGLALVYSADGEAAMRSYRFGAAALAGIGAISVARIALSDTWSSRKFL